MSNLHNEMILENLFEQFIEDEAFDMLYDAHVGKHGPEIERAVADMYNDISVDYGLHPDDDFEDIYERMIDNIVDDYGNKT